MALLKRKHCILKVKASTFFIIPSNPPSPVSRNSSSSSRNLNRSYQVPTGLFAPPPLCRQTDRHDSGFYMNTNIMFLPRLCAQAGNVVIADEHATCADSYYDCLPWPGLLLAWPIITVHRQLGCLVASSHSHATSFNRSVSPSSAWEYP